MEIDLFGWNAVTVSFLGTILFMFIRAWGYWHQVRKIWTRRSGLSVPVTNYTYMTIAAAAVCIYGWRISSLALMINGLVTILFRVPVVVGLWRFKGFGRWEKILSAGFLAALVVLVALPMPPQILMVFTAGGIFVALLQPYEIWRNRDAGAVEIRLLIVGLGNSLFWLVYSFAIGDPVLRLLNPALTLIAAMNIALWFRYRRPAPKPG